MPDINNIAAKDELHDWSRGTLEYLGCCPVCGAEENVSASYRRHDDANAMPDIWQDLRCGECGSIYLDPRPDRASLPSAYSDYYTHFPETDVFANGNSRRIIAALVNGYLNSRFGMRRDPGWRIGALLLLLVTPLRMKLDVYGRHVPHALCGTQSALLDVGCGSGAFLARANEMGLQALGCEPDPNAVATCRAQGLNVVEGDIFNAELDNKWFDMVTLNHVLEHAYDPAALLSRVHDLLVPGGQIWIGLPNPDALGLKLFGKGWKGLHPPFHLIIPSQKKLRKWTQDAGFKQVRLLRRGAQSTGLWRYSIEIAMREGTAGTALSRSVIRLLGDAMATISPRWGEETILMANKSG